MDRSVVHLCGVCTQPFDVLVHKRARSTVSTVSCSGFHMHACACTAVHARCCVQGCYCMHAVLYA